MPAKKKARAREVQLHVGTRKGAFIFRGKARRKSWKIDGLTSPAGSDVAQSFDLLKLCGSSSEKAADFKEHEARATFLLAESHLTRRLFGAMLRSIAALFGFWDFLAATEKTLDSNPGWSAAC